jgi:hypothetical protein
VKYADDIRWRLNDPAVEWRQRWTKVHRVSFHNDDLTRCHIKIPEHPYDQERGTSLPEALPRCKRCTTVDE